MYLIKHISQFKKSKLEHVSIEELRGWAELDSIEMRHEELLNDYYVKIMTTNLTHGLSVIGTHWARVRLNYLDILK